MLASLADAAPTGHGGADVVWRMAAGAVVPLLTVYARRWAWFVLVAGTAVAGQGWMVVFVAAALGLTLAAAFRFERRRWMGAVVGALAVQVLLRGVTYWFLGAPTVVSLLVCIPILVSGLRNGPRRLQAAAGGLALVLSLAAVALTVTTTVSALQAKDRITRGLDLAEEAVDLARDGDTSAASQLLQAAEAEFDAVAADLGKPWTAPAQAVPVLGQHSGALRDLSRQAARVAGAASDVLGRLDPDELTLDAGAIDLRVVRGLQAPMSDLVAELDRSITEIDAAQNQWLVSIARDRLVEARDELASNVGDVRDANDLLDIVPGLFGGDGERRYLVLFVTPAESRASGGFAGNWAELTARDGQLNVTAVGRGNDLNALVADLPQGVPIDPEYLSLHAAYSPNRFFQNITASPDFPTVAGAAAVFYETATGRPVDGVVSLDASALAALLELTGPVTIDGLRLGADNVEQWVLRDQYVQFDDDEDGREAVLNGLVVAAFDQFTTTSLPSPWRLSEVLGPVVRRGELVFVAFDEA
ncbi:MAG: DUF4012 domain-containing protein, partial [Acidimicrobiales bacterium]|nr:DUF4012 domain-containing protein [Acidimicrobiales bacterium]